MNVKDSAQVTTAQDGASIAPGSLVYGHVEPRSPAQYALRHSFVCRRPTARARRYRARQEPGASLTALSVTNAFISDRCVFVCAGSSTRRLLVSVLLSSYTKFLIFISTQASLSYFLAHRARCSTRRSSCSGQSCSLSGGGFRSVCSSCAMARAAGSVSRSAGRSTRSRGDAENSDPRRHARCPPARHDARYTPVQHLCLEVFVMHLYMGPASKFSSLSAFVYPVQRALNDIRAGVPVSP
ncbi:hypothetical protein BDW22DRAFT_587795 [Trametopsis cervina]|nr:hypothetical protein BDW22DRAFT_587795 [Trametopsis cervina]